MRDGAEQQRKKQEAFVEFREHDQVALEDGALSRCDSFIRSLLVKARRKGEVYLYHQMIWGPVHNP